MLFAPYATNAFPYRRPAQPKGGFVGIRTFVRIASQAYARVACLALIKRKSRLTDLLGDALTPAVAEIDLRSDCACPRCRGFGDVSYWELTRYASVGRLSRILNYLRPTATVIDLGATSYDGFVRAVAYQSGGNDTRMVNKARRLGYAARRIARGAHAKSIALIKESRRVRSQGVVVDSMFKASERLADRGDPFQPPPCADCWTIDWGVFGPTGVGERLVAYASLRRAGNYIEIEHMMGHGDALKHGVVKLLVFEIVEWLLRGDDDTSAGVRYLHYGAIENGSAVTAQWRRYMQFQPRLVKITARDPSVIPADFSGLQYLLLNRTLARKGLDPHVHYALYGVHEGRSYRFGHRRRSVAPALSATSTPVAADIAASVEEPG